MHPQNFEKHDKIEKFRFRNFKNISVAHFCTDYVFVYFEVSAKVVY